MEAEWAAAVRVEAASAMRVGLGGVLEVVMFSPRERLLEIRSLWMAEFVVSISIATALWSASLIPLIPWLGVDRAGLELMVLGSGVNFEAASESEFFVS